MTSPMANPTTRGWKSFSPASTAPGLARGPAAATPSIAPSPPPASSPPSTPPTLRPHPLRPRLTPACVATPPTPPTARPTAAPAAPRQTPPRPIWHITVTDAGDPVPVDARLRRMLKGMLRAYRFKCVRIETTGPAATPTQHQPSTLFPKGTP
jgi:hypothetical protein